jgi:hypothetical protein
MNTGKMKMFATRGDVLRGGVKKREGVRQIVIRNTDTRGDVREYVT